MFRVMIVEDEAHILKYMEMKLSACPDFLVIGGFSMPEEALEAFDTLLPEVVFLDIEMPRMDGITLARRLLEKKETLRIVFTTAYGQYALNAFEVEAIDYLMKPVTKEDIQRVLKRLKKGMPQILPPSSTGVSVARLPVRCFGTFDVRDRQNRLIKWPTRKTEELFAYFAAHQGQYISKWTLIDLFWPELEEERGFHNLYNTVYRIKNVLNLLPMAPQIQKVNDGYTLEAQGLLSDLTEFLLMMEKGDYSRDASTLFFTYNTPLFGARGYTWSLSLQEYTARFFGKLCDHLLQVCRDKDDYPLAEEVIRHYVKQCPEDENRMKRWLALLKGWKEHAGKVSEYWAWFNEILEAAELPLL